MDELLRDFLTETHESLDTVDVELVRFEQEPNNAEILANIFRLVHTIKGTCGFLGLPRLAALAHAAESLMGKFRDGLPVTQDAVTLILCDPRPDQGNSRRARTAATRTGWRGFRPDRPARCDVGGGLGSTQPRDEGTLVYQVLERPLKPGEATLDELERPSAKRRVPMPARASQPRDAAPSCVEARSQASRSASMSRRSNI